MIMKNVKNEQTNNNKSQRQIENVKSKRHTKTVLQKYTKEECDDEEMYSNFEKFNNRQR